MSNVKFNDNGTVTVTQRVTRRHRGDGRAIYQYQTHTHPIQDPVPLMSLDLTNVEHRMRMYMDLEGRIYHKPARQVSASAARAIGKSAAFAAMYGTSRHLTLGDEFMTYNTRYQSARDPRNGPFRVVLDPKKKWQRRSKRHGGAFEPGHKVINKHGERVHRGTQGSCNHVAEQLNLEYAKHLMLPDPVDPYRDVMNDLIDGAIAKTISPPLTGRWRSMP